MLVATPPMASPPAMGRDTVPFGTGMVGVSGLGTNGYSNSSPVPSGLTSGPSGSGSASGPARVATPPSAVPPLSAAGLSDATSKPTALSEKEQMRRYFEAKDKVERAARGEVDTSDNSEEEEGNQAGPSEAAVPAESSAGAIGRETGVGLAAGIAPAIPLSQTHPTASSSSSAHSPTALQQPQGSSGGAGAASGQYMSAEQEKDMMRQRYEEATLRANRARSSLGHQAQEFGQNGGMASPVQPALVASPASESPSAKSHIPFASASQTPVGGASSSRPSFKPGTSQFLSSQGGQSPLEIGGSGSGSGDAGSGYMTAEQEKDMMRRRFEDAQARVDKTCGRARPSDGLPPLSEPGRDASGSRGVNGDFTRGDGNSDDVSPPALATPNAPEPLPVGPSSTSHTSHTASNAQQYPTAEQEKEEMRRRFEQATSRVVSGGGGIPGGTSAGGAGGSKPLPPARPMSMQPPSRQGSTAPPVLNGTGPSSLQGLAQQGSNGASTNGAGSSSGPPPPPPLPARPPVEYINLLSPSEAPNKRYSFA